MNAVNFKTCPCGEQVPKGCVRCRECGSFLNDDVKQYHDQHIAGENAAVWMVAYNGQEFGPFPTEVLKEAFATHAVPATALVWKTGLSDWIAASKVPELSEALVRS